MTALPSKSVLNSATVPTIKLAVITLSLTPVDLDPCLDRSYHLQGVAKGFTPLFPVVAQTRHSVNITSYGQPNIFTDEPCSSPAASSAVYAEKPMSDFSRHKMFFHSWPLPLH
jgi:hypothetical protein